MVRKIFHRGDTYNTSYLSFGRLAFYVIMNTLGFLYVNISNLNCTRKSVFFSFYESKTDFVKTICFSPLFYFLGNNIALRAEHDLSAAGQKYDEWDCFYYIMTFWMTAYLIGL